MPVSQLCANSGVSEWSFRLKSTLMLLLVQQSLCPQSVHVCGDSSLCHFFIAFPSSLKEEICSETAADPGLLPGHRESSVLTARPMGRMSCLESGCREVKSVGSVVRKQRGLVGQCECLGQRLPA